MTHDALRTLCLAQPAATEDQPFGPDNVVFRVGNKIFALLALDAFPPRINLKCEPEKAIDWRERYEAVVPGYHMNKRHWNTVVCNGSIAPDDLHEMVGDSYALVRASLPRRIQSTLP